MNILYYNHYSGSVNFAREWRSYYLSKGFLSWGHEVSVVCASTHHMHREIVEQNESFINKNVDGVNFSWIKVPSYAGNGLSRIKSMLTFGAKVLFSDPISTLGLSQPDLIIASSVHPFHLLGALRWARKYKVPVFFEVRDPWPLSLNLLLGLSKWHPFSLLLQLFQYIGHKYTDKTISLAINLEPYMREHGLDEGKFLYVCNGIDKTQERASNSALDEKLTRLRDKYKRIIIYTGSHGVPNALEYVIDAFNSIDVSSIALVLVGDGKEKKNLIKRNCNSNCYFFPPVNKDEIQRVLSFADICIISWQDISMYKYGVSPNKVFDYMWAKKPIIQALNSPQNQVELANCGVNVKPGDTFEIKEAILDLSNRTDDELTHLGEKGYDFLMENYEFKDLAKKILDAYKDV
ncbi:glycosyltransferase family 4 protein [Colwellia psychrerythraea]|nr:glycosyltransferase family 4 protein [Colwellia psychrerythraea]